MIVIARPRWAGKTTEAIKVANQTGAYLVVLSRQEAARIAPDCKRAPIALQDFLAQDRLKGSLVKNIVIDDAETLIQQFVGGSIKIDAITVNGGGYHYSQDEAPAGAQAGAAAMGLQIRIAQLEAEVARLRALNAARSGADPRAGMKDPA